MVFVSLGIFMSFVAGTYIPYAHVPFVFIALPVLFIIGQLFLPDTCPQLLVRDRYDEAEKSFIFYRLGNRLDDEHRAYVTDELQRLQMFLKTNASQEANTRPWELLSECAL